MKRIIFVSIYIIAQTACVAQPFAGVLRTIEENNTALRAAREANRATMTQRRAENSVGATSVEYSPFYGSGISGTASSELIVSQEFDFPTLYAARKKSNDMQQQVLDLQYMTLRRDILLQAEKLCYDYVTAERMRALLLQKQQNSDSLLTVYEKRLKHGEATILDLNRIRMDRMAVMTEVARYEGNRRSIMLELQKLNGGKAELPDIICDEGSTALAPLPDIHAVRTTLEEQTATAALEASRQEVKVEKQGWIPKLTMGYRRNTEQKEATNGFLVGVQMPLFSNGGKVKAARQRVEAARQEEENTKVEARAALTARYAEAEQLLAMLKAYDVPLMQQTLALLLRAVNAGELSIATYYQEANTIYSSLLERLTLENEYNKKNSELNAQLGI